MGNSIKNVCVYIILVKYSCYKKYVDQNDFSRQNPNMKVSLSTAEGNKQVQDYE